MRQIFAISTTLNVFSSWVQKWVHGNGRQTLLMVPMMVGCYLGLTFQPSMTTFASGQSKPTLPWILLLLQLQLLLEFRQLALLGVVAGAVTCQGVLENGVLCHFRVVRELVVAKSSHRGVERANVRVERANVRVLGGRKLVLLS